MRARQLRQGIIAVLLVLAALWLGSLIWGLASKADLAIGQARDAKRQYQTLEARKEALSADTTALNTPLGQDAAIREAFGVAKSGEEVIVVVPPAASTPTSTPPWWRRVLNWF